MIDHKAFRQAVLIAIRFALPLVMIATTLVYGPSIAQLFRTNTAGLDTPVAQASTDSVNYSPMRSAELMAVDIVSPNHQLVRSNTEQVHRPTLATPLTSTSTPTSTPTLNASATSSPAPVALLVSPVAVTPQPEQPLAQPNAADAPETLPAGYRMFNGRPIRPARTMTMVTTAYSPDYRSCGASADGITASGKSVWTNGMKMVAADTRLLPFGTLISIPGYYNDQPVPVLDRGGAIKGHRLDLLYPTHEIALQWGRQKQQVTIWEYAD